MSIDLPEPPIACTLGAADFNARIAWIADLNRRALRAHHRADLRLELAYDAQARDEVLDMVRGEQACCAFLDFEVRHEPGLVKVIIQAPERARQAAELLFEPFQAKTAGLSACSCCGAA